MKNAIVKARETLRRICFTRTLLALIAFTFAAYGAAGADFKDRGAWQQRIEGEKYNRVYSVYAPDLNWDAMIQYAKSKPWSGPGTSTIVCFFGDWRNTPDVTFTGMNFSDHYKEHWIAGYWFKEDGSQLFVQHPARKVAMNFY